ncbi:lysophospholipid acyltransferase family protein [Minwuia sp.]|uniref:lysophospholipid acyltransferase family protein n=1 Tax=Minwuia sp. TaxID=2493630 RepID=UPI003A8D1344
MSVRKQIDYLWRLFATGVSFLIFGVVGLVFSVTFFPAINLIYRSDRQFRQEMARRAIASSWKVYLKFMSILGVLELKFEGIAELQSDQGVIVISNHPTLLDIVVLISVMKNAQCIVKQGVWNNPVMRSAVRSANYIPNSDDPEELLRKCSEGLVAGNNIIVFPEGSRTRPGEPMKLQRGFAQLAYRAGAPMRLVEMRCEPPTLLKGQKWYDIPPSRPHFSVRVAERIDLSALDLEVLPSRAVRQITKHVAARYKELMPDGKVGS